MINLTTKETEIQIGRAMQKSVFEHMRTAKPQISLRIRAVWLGPSLSANRFHYRMNQLKVNARIRLGACMGWEWICAFCACSKTYFGLSGPISIYVAAVSIVSFVDFAKEDICLMSQIGNSYSNWIHVAEFPPVLTRETTVQPEQNRSYSIMSTRWSEFV